MTQYPKIDILAFAAHPDDVELSCAGSLLLHIASGKKVGIIDLTRGELGTRGSAEIRNSEAEAASKIMGIHARENLELEDGFFSVNRESQLKIIRCIRKYQPEIVFANAISDRHPDHGRAARLVSESCFLSGLRKIESSIDNIPQSAWRPKQVYHYIQDHFIKPDVVVDITDFMDQKMQAIRAYKSQFYSPESKEPSTAISIEYFLDFIYARALDMGRTIGVKYAEGFTAERPIGVSNLFFLQ